MNDETKPKPPRKRWKRILKWTVGAILVALIAWAFIAYGTSTNDCGRYAATPINPMKAIVYCDYGLPNLKLQEIEKPTPADDQLLVRVHAASINPSTGTSLKARRTSVASYSGSDRANQRRPDSVLILPAR